MSTLGRLSERKDNTFDNSQHDTGTGNDQDHDNFHETSSHISQTSHSDDSDESEQEDAEWFDPSELADLIAQATSLKEQGNAHFAAERTHAALECYREAIACLPAHKPLKPPQPLRSKGKGKARKDLAEQWEDSEDGEDDVNEDAVGSSSQASSTAPVRSKDKIRELKDEKDEDAFVAEGKQSDEEKELAILRSALWNNVSACQMRLSLYKEAAEAATEALKDQPDYIKALQRRAAANEKVATWSSLSSALEDYNTLATLQGTPTAFKATIRQAQRRLPPLIEVKKNEETKEMMDKLKGLGNMFLGKFGMSTDNFQFVKNEETGGYSMNFVQNPGPKQS